MSCGRRRLSWCTRRVLCIGLRFLFAANGTQRHSRNAEEDCYTKSVNNRSGIHDRLPFLGIASPSLPASKRTGFSPSARLGVILFAWVTHVARTSKRTAALKSSALAPFADRLILHAAKMRELLTIFRFPPGARQSKTLNIGGVRACDEQITLKPSGRDYCTSVSSSKIRATTSLREADNSSAALQLLY